MAAMRSSLGEPEKVGNTVDDMSLQRVAVTHHFRFLCTVRATTSQRHVEANNRFVFAVNDQFKFVRVYCVTCRGDRIMSRRRGFDCTKITQYTRKARRFCAVLLQCRPVRFDLIDQRPNFEKYVPLKDYNFTFLPDAKLFERSLFPLVVEFHL